MIQHMQKSVRPLKGRKQPESYVVRSGAQLEAILNTAWNHRCRARPGLHSFQLEEIPFFLFVFEWRFCVLKFPKPTVTVHVTCSQAFLWSSVFKSIGFRRKPSSSASCWASEPWPFHRMQTGTWLDIFCSHQRHSEWTIKIYKGWM